MPTVKYAISAYVADGTTTDYLITWDYLDDDHIAVYVDGTSNADPQANHTFTKLNNTTLRVTTGVGAAISAGAEIEIRRETPLQNRAITFADGSALLAEDLNKNSDYLLYSMQEVLDTVESAAQDGALQAQAEAELNRDETIVLKNTTAGYLATVQADEQAADAHRIAAAASEAAALVSENAAEASETAAAASEVAAAASETAAAASEVAAQTAETGAIAAQTGVLAAQTASEAARDAAQTAQTAAETAETNAEASETAAAASATAAAASEAGVAADAATATTKAAEASASETNANSSRAAAANSASNAAASESFAWASRSAAAASETAAATSETNAANSATAAASSETAAAASETAAATSETNAESAWDSLDDRYLGAKSTAPTVDNDGGPILTGALYWNSTSSKMYVWSGSSWSFTQDGLATVATSGDYNDLINVPPSTASSIVKYATDPSGASEGDVYYNTSTDVIRVFNGTAWGNVSNASPALVSQATRSLSSVSENASYSVDIGVDFIDDDTASNDLTYALASGSLPSGISLPSQGSSNITGTAPTVSSDTTYNFSVTATDASGATSAAKSYTLVVTNIPSGQSQYVIAGTFTWVAPTGVSSVSAVAVGGGGAGLAAPTVSGGGGGLGWKNNIPVTAGNSYTVVVGARGTRFGGTDNTSAATGGDSYFISTSTVRGGGGRPDTGLATVGQSGGGGSFTGDGGGNGGNGRWGTGGNEPGGGGAGGYSGSGGIGGNGTSGTAQSNIPTNGSGGGGGGGGNADFLGSGGGGVGLNGQGANGAASSSYTGNSPSIQFASPAGGGSGGGDAFFSASGSDSPASPVDGGRSHGGNAGGGGFGRFGNNGESAGAVGAVRIIWGPNRSFPSNAS